MTYFFLDPVFRAPIWGSIFMCIASSLMGVIIFLRKRSLLAETLSHAAYPGACFGALIFAYFFPNLDEWAFLPILAGAFFSSLLGLKAVRFLEERAKVYSDAALCFVLACFFGIGIIISSGMQQAFPVWYQNVRTLLFGQAATMTDIHIWIYGGLTACVVLFLFLTFRPLQASLFDPTFAKSAKIPVAKVEKIVFWLLLVSLIVGIRSVGVVLMTGMVIAPAVFARSFSNQLKNVLILSAIIGGVSGALGSALSIETHLPTGPAIVLVGAFFALFALLFAPKRGLVFRLVRIFFFRLQCIEENVLKGIWKKGELVEEKTLFIKFVLWRLQRQGWIDKKQKLTKDGEKKGSLIVRLHRLWELYLTEELGFLSERVHRTAEEMEHILTLEMEKKLTNLLADPLKDPHEQPIPRRGG